MKITVHNIATTRHANITVAKQEHITEETKYTKRQDKEKQVTRQEKTQRVQQ